MFYHLESGSEPPFANFGRLFSPPIKVIEILGVIPDRGSATLPLFANSDFHDGQVLIDVKNKTITILDFGQAVWITNEERANAVEILHVISGAESAKEAAVILNQVLDKTSKTRFTELEIAALLKKA